MADSHVPQAGIIGAGIAGLAAAIALRRAGWQCEVFERSTFKNEIGAAISVTPNATRCLDHWGFDTAKARPVQNQQFRMMMAEDLQVVINEEYPDLEQQFGHKSWSFHRVDLHKGLLDLAVERGECKGLPAVIRLGCQVQGVDFSGGNVVLANGKSIKKDLIVVADGAHSRIVGQMASQSNLKSTGRSIYRCLIPMHKIMSDPEIKALYEGQLPGFLGILDPIDDVLFVTYPCRDNEVMNCAVVHNSRHQRTEDEITSWNEPVPWTEILETAHNFHPTAKKILSMASDAESDVKVHHLMKRAPMSSYVRDRAVVIGDAAHVMLPTHAAGGAVTIESAACLGILFDKISMPTDTGLIESRLKLFDKLRLGRCNMTMILSNASFAGIGVPGVEEEVRRYYDGPLPPSGSIPWSAESREIFFNYNALEEARKVLHEELLE